MRGTLFVGTARMRLGDGREPAPCVTGSLGDDSALRPAYCGVQVSDTIFTLRAVKDGPLPVDGRVAAGSAGVVVTSALSLSLTAPVTSTVWPMCSMSLVDGLGMIFSVVADATAGGIVEPDVPTAPVVSDVLDLSLHFRSDRMKLSGESPAFKQPVTVTDFAAALGSCIGG